MKLVLSTIALWVCLAPISLSAQDEFPDSTFLPPITVSADPLNPSLLEFGKPASVMDEEEIIGRNESTLGETIGNEPGVRSSYFGQGASRPVIRGFAGDRVQVLKNGVGTGDVSNLSDDHVVAADPLQASQIEILRGPETLLYGGAAIGGAVNVTDDSIPETALGREFSGSILGQLGNSADNERTAAVKLRGEQGKFNWHASGFTRETDSYEIPGFAESPALREEEEADHDEEETRGKVSNSDVETLGGTVGGSYVWDDGFVGLSFGGFDSEYGVPGHAHGHDEEHEGSEHEDEHEAETEEESVSIDAQQRRLDLRGRVDNVSDSLESIKFKVGLSDYTHDELEGAAVGTTYDREAVDSRIEFVHTPVGSFRGAFGLQLTYDDFSAIGEEAFLTPTKTWSPALFVFEKLPILERLHLEFGGRVESVNVDPDGLPSESFLPFSLSAGPVWDPLGDQAYNVGLTFSYTERAPTSVELFSNGAHISRQIFEIGNAALQKEASWGVDLSARKNSGLVTGAFTPFYQGFTNYINLTGTGEELDEFSAFTYEGIEAYFWGFELESTLNVNELAELGMHSVAVDFQLDYVRARDTDANANLPRIPPLRTIVRGRYSWDDQLFGQVEGVFVDEQDDVSEFESPTDSYALLNAEASFRLPMENDSDLRIFVRGTNLTDDEARVHSSFLKDLAPLRGRSFLFGVRGTI